jgi:sporulation protein YlmC with PRC-barrel domain
MRVDLDAKVRTHEGEDAGSIERAIVDPKSNEITEFVVNTGGFLGRNVRVPRAEVESASQDGDALRLRLSKADLEGLPTYVPTDYVPPPMWWGPSLAYGFPVGGALWPAAYGGPLSTMAPVDPLARGAGVDPGMTPPADVQSPDAESDVSIPKGASVIDRDGNDVGVVDDVRLDPNTGQVLGFVLRVGGVLWTLLGGGETTEITSSLVDHISEGAVHLSATKDELEQAAAQPR